jgi:hypothetical protein
MDNRSKLHEVLFFIIFQLLKLPLLPKVSKEKHKVWLALDRKSLAGDLEILRGIQHLVADVSLLASLGYLLEDLIQLVLFLGVELAAAKRR